MAQANQSASATWPTYLDGLSELWTYTLGDPEVCIAILDGPVDLSHSSLKDAHVAPLHSLADGATNRAMLAHGTHVASIIFGQPNSPVHGIAPRCRGLLIPIFGSGDSARVPQLELARAIEQAVQNGALVVNISGVERSANGSADPLLQRAVKLCQDAGVLVVAATGNDGCECLGVPAALPGVLAVGAMSQDGIPLASSNWGASYQENGILAPGQNIRGAIPNNGISFRTGTSFAAPIVAGIAGLLLSFQKRNGLQPDARSVRDALLASALPCAAESRNTSQCLRGTLNVHGAWNLITTSKGEKPRMPDQSSLPANASSHGESAPAPVLSSLSAPGLAAAVLDGSDPTSLVGGPHSMPARAPSAGSTPAPSSSLASANTPVSCSCNSNFRSYVFAIGSIGYDFGTEARRDSFRQLMPHVDDRPANPYSADQMANYLELNPSESTKLIWTFNLELTPIYAIRAELPYAREVYDFLRKALRGQIEPESSPNYISRVSLPGILTSETVRLFSGQVVPVVLAQNRGLWSWNVNALVDAVLGRFEGEKHEPVRASVRNFLDKVYYELRNLGQTSQDRALNYSATNAFQATESFSRVLFPKHLVPSAGVYTLDRIGVSKSPFCRMDSDCWDVKLSFFDSENERRARMVVRFTVDVSDELPVTLGPVRHWTESSNCC